VIDVAEVVSGEIWSLKVSTGETFYVLEATCEVIGHPPAAKPDYAEARCHLRADWSDYVAEKIRRDNMGGCNALLDRMRWANEAEYDRGISRHWLNRIATAGDQGVQLRRIAERYCLACVVSNRYASLHFPKSAPQQMICSISGSWKSSIQMAQDMQGLADPGPQDDRRGQRQSLNFFLQE